ncbi:MAG: hypothetical protein U1E81_12420 [Xanthobacteraceae bacterium]
MAEHYLSDRVYFRLVRKLAGCGNDLEQIKQTLGEVGDVWPKSVKIDNERSDKLAAEARARLARQVA